MRVTVKPGTAHGSVCVPPSKSIAHRALICAALSDGICRVRGVSDCEDVGATLRCLRALGATAEYDGTDVIVRGIGKPKAAPLGVLDAGESGSTLRFFIPIALLCAHPVTFTGSPTLLSRPMNVYADLSGKHGFTFRPSEREITVCGPLEGGTFTVAGNISSQFISGLLFALPLAARDSTIRITTAVDSRPYIDLTLSTLAEFGITAQWKDEKTLFIPGNQTYRATDVRVDADESAAAFPYALNFFGGDVELLGVNPDSIQGDRVFRQYYPLFDRGIPTVYIGDTPDLGPILFALAAAKSGGIFSGTARLKIKESDRAAAMAEELSKFGVRVSVEENSVAVYPAEFHAPSVPLSGHNDHRIVMALAVLCTLTGGVIEGAEAVKKSYPGFFDDLSKLGIELTKEEEI